MIMQDKVFHRGAPPSPAASFMLEIELMCGACRYSTKQTIHPDFNQFIKMVLLYNSGVSMDYYVRLSIEM